MAESYFIRLQQERFAFTAAHFITFDGQCEPLHGHNWLLSAEIHGPLDEHHYVADFVAVGDLLAEIARQLDHRVLLPSQHPALQVSTTETEVSVTFQQRRWVLPRDQCALLPVPNTTAEQLARFIGQQLLDALQDQLGFQPAQLRLGLQEGIGQWAWWQWTPQPV